MSGGCRWSFAVEEDSWLEDKKQEIFGAGGNMAIREAL